MQFFRVDYALIQILLETRSFDASSKRAVALVQLGMLPAPGRISGSVIEGVTG